MHDDGTGAGLGKRFGIAPVVDEADLARPGRAQRRNPVQRAAITPDLAGHGRGDDGQGMRPGAGEEQRVACAALLPPFVP